MTITITDRAEQAASAAGATSYEAWRTDRDRDTRPIRTIAVKAARAGAEAAAPHIAAQALRGFADSAHPHAEGVSYPTNYGCGIEHDAICSGCGASWDSDEGGCTERVELLKAAREAEAPTSSSEPEETPT